MAATIKFSLSEQGRRASLLAGGDGKRDQEIAVNRDDPIFARLVEMASLDPQGNVTLNLRSWDQYGEPTQFDFLPTVEQLLSEPAARAARRESEKAAYLAKKIQELRSAIGKFSLHRSEVTHTDGGISASALAEYRTANLPYADKTQPEIAAVLESPEMASWLASLESEKQTAIQAAQGVAKKLWQEKKDAAAAAAAKRKAFRDSLGLTESQVALKIEDGALACVPSGCWESNRRGKNWLAKISVDSSAPGGLARQFAEKARGEYYYLLPDVNPGDPIEFGADYYSGSGRKSPARWYGYVVRVTDTHLILEPCTSGKDAVTRGAKFAATATASPSSADAISQGIA